ncbi:N-acetylneuraminate epimerase [Salmonella enterica subsp. enterica serovar Eastbourne]|nr:N-acetylneuraminate epimerase [Salmonella enterica subsp. enterica serovar Eastbourne]EHC5910890.1 N-acetylneuraminate epimerase [Salmonella enterica subsp. enterica serovar Eastbourne]
MKKILIVLAMMMASFEANASVLPETPVPFKSGTGVILNNTVYIGLGSAGTAWYKLDAQSKNKKWTELPKFPGGQRDQATSAVIDGNIYVFGGVGKNKQGLTQVFSDVHMYNPKTSTWEKLMSHAPFGMAGHVTFVHNGKIFITGGVNQNIFNGYFEDSNEAGKDSTIINKINGNYFGKKTEDYFFNKFLLCFDPSTQQWSFAGESPWGGTAGAAVVNDEDKIWLINGEVKPGLRTDSVFQLDLSGDEVKWNKLLPVSSPDGVAGGFAGISNGNIIFAGGAGFKGSRKNYLNGKNYAHEGLHKFYSTDIHLWRNGKWNKSGELTEGRAYGVYLPWNNGLLIIGGETDGGKAVTDSLLLTMKGHNVIVQH